MILKTNKVESLKLEVSSWKLYVYCFIIAALSTFATCKYTTKDVSIPTEVKTFKVSFFENKAQYVNPILSPQLTEKIKQKIINTTRLKQTNSDDAHYDISGYITQYYTATAGVSGNNASANRLTVVFHLIMKNNLNDKESIDTDISRNFDFPASQSLSQAESSLNSDIIKNIVDDIFNKIFSNW